MRLFFFIGKGGVGKSTLSSLCALALSQNKKKVVLSSLDPAHNLSDIFEQKFNDKPAAVNSNLQVIEVDQDKWVKKYLQESELQFSKSYSYLTSFSLDKHFAVIRNAPGIEEYGLLLGFQNIIQNNDADVYIFDMPPTGLALHFFSLPQISLLWLQQLTKLRKEIQDKQKIISKLSLGNKTFERDRVMQNIEKQVAFWQKLHDLFSNIKSTRFVLIQNPDTLSNSEAEKIKAKIKDLNLAPLINFLNKKNEGDNDISYDFSFNRMPTHIIDKNALQQVLNTISLQALLTKLNF